MNLKFYLLSLLLLAGQAMAQNNNRGRARPDYNPENLTDAQRRESESFVHQGKSQRLAIEGCAKEADVGLTDAETKLFQENPSKAYEQFGDKLKKAQELCGGQAEVKGLGLSPEMAGAISKAYTMVIGVAGAGGGLKLKDLDAVAAKRQEQADALKPAEGEPELTGDAKQAHDDAQAKADEAKQDAEGEDDRDNTDYCKYIAVGTEAIAMVQQTMAQQEINRVPLEEESNAQRASLMRVSRGYEERAKNANTQFIGWGATSGCYAVMMFTPISQASASAWQNWLKLGATGFLAKVFYDQREGFREASNKTKKVANLLPGTGDCNPHTDRDCYCSEPTTMNHPQYCVPYLHKNQIRDAGISMRTACINNQAQADPQCRCLADDSCVHTGIDTMFKIDGIAGQVNPAMLNDLKGLSSGTAASFLNTDATNRNLSAARNAMRKADEELAKLAPPNPSLSPAQQKEAAFLEAQGVPATLSKAIASTDLGGKDPVKTLASFQSSFTPPSQATKSTSFNASVRDAPGGSGLRPKQAAKKDAAANPFAKFMNQGKAKAAPTGNILNLAQKAEAQAQISNRKETSVFEIISRRYQVSAWRRLELDKDF